MRFCASEIVTQDTEKLEMYVAIAWDEGKQVITVVGSDSCLLKACKQFTEVQAFQTQNVSHCVIIMLHPHAGLALAWMSHPFCHFIISDKLGFQKKKDGLDLYHWLSLLFINHCTMEALAQLPPALKSLCHRIRVEVFSYNRMTSF